MPTRKRKRGAPSGGGGSKRTVCLKGKGSGKKKGKAKGKVAAVTRPLATWKENSKLEARHEGKVFKSYGSLRLEPQTTAL